MERQGMGPTLLDGMAADLGGPRTGQFLERVAEVIDFEALAKRVRAEVAPEQPKGGRPFWPVVMMLKCVLLGKWYGLSDAGLEEQLRDRVSFRRFVGLSLSEATPDETTFVNFRKRLREEGHGSTLFDAVLEQLRGKGLVLTEGSLVDATIVEAPRGGKREDGTSTRDGCASFTRKHGRTYHGYKAHVNVSKDRIVTDYVFDSASTHDSQHIDTLTENERHAVYADSAYMDRKRSERLKSRGVHDGIVERRVRGQAELRPEQKARNAACSKVRALVEHPFAWMKQQMGYGRARYRGLQRNGLDFGLTAMAYNIKRSLSLLGMALTQRAKAA
jgi:IS5 family transposase